MKNRILFRLTPPVLVIILSLLLGVRSHAQEGNPCGCPDPTRNVVITEPNGQTLTDLQTQYDFFTGESMTNTCISIQGKLLINKDFTITGGEIIMLPGSEITVWGSMTFTLQDVNQNGGVHGCTAMWKGIRALSNSSSLIYINIVNSTIQDARHAVLTHKRTALKAENSDFINNWFGILVPNLPNSIPPFPFNNTTLALSGNLFTFNGAYLPTFAGFTSDPILAVANYILKYNTIGILSDNASGLAIGTGTDIESVNTFEKLNVGIIGIHSNLTINNCHFLDMHEGLNNVTTFSKGGVFVENGQIRNTTIRRSYFNECQIAVLSTNTNTSFINQNRVQNCPWGLFVREVANRSLLIEDNSIRARSGLSIFGNGIANNISIHNNDITAVPAFPLLPDYGSGGIALYGNGVLKSNGTFRISNNRINTPAYNSNFGSIAIYVTGVPEGLTIKDNDVLLTQHGHAIIISNSKRLIINNNNIAVHELSDDNTHGIGMYDSPNCEIACNTINIKSGAGVFFQGACDCEAIAGDFYCTKLQGNTIDRISTDLNSTLYSDLRLFNAVISPQPFRGNKWVGPINGPFDYGAVYTGELFLAPYSRFITHTNHLPYHPELVYVNNFVQDPGIWFQVMSGTAFECSPMVTGGGGNGGSEVLEIFEHYAEGAFESAGYGKGARWTADRHLYRNLKTAPALTASSPVLQQFYTAAQTSALGKLYEVEQGLQSLNLIPEAVKAELDALSEEEKELSKELEDLFALPDPTNARDLAALETARTEAAEAFDIVASEIQTIYNTLEAVRLNKLQQLQAFNAGIAATEAPAQYVKTVYTIALTHAADHSELTPAERSLLEPIATLCPSEGGDAVYSARALLGWLQHDNCNELPELSLQQALPQLSTTASLETWGIFPNPGHDDFSILTPATPSGRAELKIYDIMGHTVFRSLIPAGERSALQLPFLRGGLYLYEVSDAGQRLLIGKLSKLD